MTNITEDDFDAMSMEQKLKALFTLGLENKQSMSKIAAFQTEMTDFKKDVNTHFEKVDDDVTDLKTRMDALEKAQQSHVKETNKRFVLNDLHAKKFNLLFHGIPVSVLYELSRHFYRATFSYGVNNRMEFGAYIPLFHSRCVRKASLF